MKKKMQNWSVAIPMDKVKPIIDSLTAAMLLAEKSGLSVQEFMVILEEFRKMIFKATGTPFVTTEAMDADEKNLAERMKQYNEDFKNKFEEKK